MMMRRSFRAGWLAAGLVLIGSPAAAQSLFATGGLGIPTPPLDARARALGTGVGLLGLSTSLVNPAETGGFLQKGFVGTIQPVSRDIELGGASSSVSATRFPLMRLLFPIGTRTVLSVSYGSFMEQSWSVRSEEQVQLGGESVRALDVHASDGGIAQARLGAAFSLRPNLSIGAAAGLYTGELERSLTRTFPDSAQIGVREFSTRSRWSYGAPLAVVGFRWDPVPVARIGAALTWSGELEADGQDDAPDHRFALPLRVDAGASAYLSSQLSLSVGGGWANWGDAAENFDIGPPRADDDLRTLPARNTWDVGGGLEWAGVSTVTRTFPVRAGFRYAQLPFAVGDDSAARFGEPPTEWSAALGLGLRIRDEESGPTALVDATLERGSLSGAAGSVGDLNESFWRVNISLALFGR